MTCHLHFQRFTAAKPKVLIISNDRNLKCATYYKHCLLIEIKNGRINNLPALSWTHLSAFIVETLQKALQQLISIVDALSILSHNPDHGGTRLRLIQGVQVFTQSGNHTLIPADGLHKTRSHPVKYHNYMRRDTVMKNITQRKLI